MSQLEVDKIIPQSGTTLTIGDSGDTISFAEGTNLGIDTNTLVIDSTNNRVGIKNASPTVELDVTGSVAVSGTVTATSFVGDGSSLTGVSSVGGATGVDFNDNVKARFGTGNDLEIYHDGSHSYISDQGTGQLRFLAENFQVRDAGNTSTMIYATPNSSVQLYHNNSTKLETTSTGVDVTGTVTADGVSLGDNEYIQLGASNDLQIYHTGSDSWIYENGTGDFKLATNGPVIRLQKGTTEIMADFKPDSGVDLYYDNSKKFETTSTGATVTGTLTATSFSGDGSGLTNVPAGVSNVNTVVVTSSGTYTPTSGTKFVTVYATGGGGGGGSAKYNATDGDVAGGGAGGGGTAIRTYNATELGANASVTIGSGASGGSNGNSGSDGGSTSFNPAGTGSTITGNGGQGGRGTYLRNRASHGGNGGTASSGEINRKGNTGNNGKISADTSTEVVAGGHGGSSFFGGGANHRQASHGQNNSGFNGLSNTGGGGGGGCTRNGGNEASASGGSGGSGVVVIMEYA